MPARDRKTAASTAAPRSETHFDVRVVLGVFALLVFVRALVVTLTRDDIVFRAPYLDAAFYHFWARSLAAGAGDFVDAYFLGPLYPHALSWVVRALGHDVLWVRVLQTLLGLANVALVWVLARRLYTPLAGMAAASLYAFYGTAFFYEGILVMETLFTTLVLAACVLLLLPAAPSSARLRQAMGIGLLLGAATGGRGTVLLLLPLAVWFLASPLPAPSAADTAPGTSRRSKTWLPVLLMVGLWIVTLLPLLQHNASRGAPLTLTTNAGVNFYAGNHADSRGRFRPPPGIEFFKTPPQAHAAEATGDAGMQSDTTADLTPALRERALTTAAVAGTDEAADSGAWWSRSLEWMRAHPGDAALLWLRKLGLVLQGAEIGQIESPGFQQQRLPVLRIFWVGWSLLLSLAVVGLVFLGRDARWRHTTRRVLWLMLALLLPCVIFFVTARYRLVAVPLLCVLAGLGVQAAWQIGRTQRRSLWRLVVVGVAVFALTRIGGGASTTRQAWENAQMAERLYADGALGEAITYQETALSLQPQRLPLQLNLALYLSERQLDDDLERADQMFRGMAARHPQQPLVLFNWGSVRELLGDLQGARRLYRRSLEIDPGFDAARQRLRDLGAP